MHFRKRTGTDKQQTDRRGPATAIGDSGGIPAARG
jgi:hypothetical protein